MTELGQAVLTFLLAAAGTGLGAQLAVRQYLDQKRRESAERRYLDGCLDLLAQDIVRSATAEVHKLLVARDLLNMVAAGPVPESIIDGYRGRLTPSAPGFGPAYLRFTTLIEDASVFRALVTCAQVIDGNHLLCGPGFFFIVGKIAKLEEGRRRAAAERLSAAYHQFSEAMGSVMTSMPLALSKLADVFSEAIYTDFEFDFVAVKAAMERELPDVRELLARMEAEIEEASKQAHAEYRRVEDTQ